MRPALDDGIPGEAIESAGSEDLVENSRKLILEQASFVYCKLCLRRLANMLLNKPPITSGSFLGRMLAPTRVTPLQALLML